jgi:hypothetical protein
MVIGVTARQPAGAEKKLPDDPTGSPCALRLGRSHEREDSAHGALGRMLLRGNPKVFPRASGLLGLPLRNGGESVGHAEAD